MPKINKEITITVKKGPDLIDLYEGGYDGIPPIMAQWSLLKQIACSNGYKKAKNRLDRLKK